MFHRLTIACLSIFLIGSCQSFNKSFSLSNKNSKKIKLLDPGSEVRSGAENDAMPPDAKIGQCFERVTFPAIIETRKEKVVLEEERTVESYTEAVYQNVQEQMVVKPSSEILRTIPATYKIVKTKVLAAPAQKIKKIIPAKYEFIRKKVEVKPATTKWEKSPDGADLMCLVEVPAKYQTIRRKVLVVPEREEVQQIAAVYKTVDKKIVDQPMRVVRTEVPAEYKTVSVRKLVEPSRKIVQTIPAKYKKIQKEYQLQPEKKKWAQVLCKKNANESLIVRLQNSLKSAGYLNSESNGIIDQPTLSAVNKYQQENNLPRSSQAIPLTVIESFVGQQDLGGQYAH